MGIEFEDVHKTLTRKGDQTHLFSRVNFSIPDDRAGIIFAPPGAGKTSLARLASGNIPPDRGRIRRDGKVSFPVGSQNVFNNILTPRENIAFLCRVYGFSAREVVDFVCDFADLGDVIDRRTSSLDKDSRSRLQFTLPYAMPFDHYVVDETLTGGREPFRAKCEALVAYRMQSAGFLVVASTPKTISKSWDHVFVLANMRVTEVASVEAAMALVKDMPAIPHKKVRVRDQRPDENEDDGFDI
ncbi:hypothetical protein [Methylobrevis pamukkalensis]|uniref:Polysialic acid transport ATP-binding protein KpsT n=1 Tax=Methylobrevis pamukkalensis TaxID=1439726 RepID=A0A1E3H6J6_9HYPH|nr:hypothetical protein [Methylobrevis pamukkalensis]ODN71943.1 Polysialic acid transport ATP-binding protein KpsT [Methylobrevis pamukkalensis]